MANTGQPDTGGGQWFIITGTDGAGLPPHHAIVGTVVAGYEDAVAALAALADPLAPNGVPPLQPIEFISITISEGCVARLPCGDDQGVEARVLDRVLGKWAADRGAGVDPGG